MALLPTTSVDAGRSAPADVATRTDVSWELDEHTRELGRRGLAAARRALAHASSPLAA